MFYVLVVITLVTATTRAQTQIPTFANTGGPPDLTGAMYADFGYIGLLQPSGFASSVYLGQDSNEFQLQMGKYTSWECTGNAGEYRATATRRDIYSNGTVVIAQHCEIGKLVPPDSYYWISSTTGCPDVNTTFPESSRITILVNSTTLPPPDFSNLTCSKGANPVGMNTTTNAGLNLQGVTVGVTQFNTTLPAVQNTSAGGFPPVFENKGITPEIYGIYENQGTNSLRMVFSPGKSTILLYNKSADSYSQSFGAYGTYECIANISAYHASLMESFFDQNSAAEPLRVEGCVTGNMIDDAVVSTLGLVSCPEPTTNGFFFYRIAGEPANNSSGKPTCVVSTSTGSSSMNSSSPSRLPVLAYMVSVVVTVLSLCL